MQNPGDDGDKGKRRSTPSDDSPEGAVGGSPEKTQLPVPGTPEKSPPKPREYRNLTRLAARFRRKDSKSRSPKGSRSPNMSRSPNWSRGSRKSESGAESTEDSSSSSSFARPLVVPATEQGVQEPGSPQPGPSRGILKTPSPQAGSRRASPRALRSPSEALAYFTERYRRLKRMMRREAEENEARGKRSSSTPDYRWDLEGKRLGLGKTKSKPKKPRSSEKKKLFTPNKARSGSEQPRPYPEAAEQNQLRSALVVRSRSCRSEEPIRRVHFAECLSPLRVNDLSDDDGEDLEAFQAGRIASEKFHRECERKEREKAQVRPRERLTREDIENMRKEIADLFSKKKRSFRKKK